MARESSLAVAAPSATEKLNVFISYSRRDVDFADRLANALSVRGFHVEIDRRDLPKLEDWERELQHLIQQCDTVVLVVSPNSLKSPVVNWEVDQVRLAGKRLAPIIIADVEGVPVPPDVSRINYIYFTDAMPFEQHVDELGQALNTDRAWLMEHTRLSELARHWIECGRTKDSLIRGRDVKDAMAWAARRPREAPPITDAQREFLAASQVLEAREARWRRYIVAAVAALAVGGAGYSLWLARGYAMVLVARERDERRPQVLSEAAERALQPKDVFHECALCPTMVVVPPGEFVMGSPEDEPGHDRKEGPQHEVAIERSFAVSEFEVTFDEWAYCASFRSCQNQKRQDEGWGEGNRPVIKVSWDDARDYAAWLSTHTGRPYHLLSEAEWEYAARAGSKSAYSWGNDGGSGNADCDRCGSRWDKATTAPVGSFSANAFGLYDMHGNVWEWVEDCWHDTYDGAPSDGSAWTASCDKADQHVVRGGSWEDTVVDLRAAARYGGQTDIHTWVNGIRVARTLHQ
jgi:formylglycine-generating enzyme required for sulfatase activity